MIYQSTRGSEKKVNSAQAVLNGLADDGGLYMMEKLPEFDAKACLAKETKDMAKVGLKVHMCSVELEAYASLS